MSYITKLILAAAIVFAAIPNIVLSIIDIRHIRKQRKQLEEMERRWNDHDATKL